MWHRRPRPEPARASAPTGGSITAISQQGRDPERISVYLDGAFAFGLGAAEAITAGLCVGEELSAERVEALLALDEVGRATRAALQFVAQRPRSVREVQDRLGQRGFAPRAIETAIEKLADWDYLDDEDFARLWVENRERLRPRGRRLLEQELRQKGVERETVQAALDAAELDEFAAATSLGRAKLRGYAGLEPIVVRRRLGGFLARRGYDAATVRAVLDHLIQEESDQPDLDESPDA